MRSRLGSARTAWGGSQLGRTHDPLERPTAWQSNRQKRRPRGGRFGRCPDKLGGYFAWCRSQQTLQLDRVKPSVWHKLHAFFAHPHFKAGLDESGFQTVDLGEVFALHGRHARF